MDTIFYLLNKFESSPALNREDFADAVRRAIQAGAIQEHYVVVLQSHRDSYNIVPIWSGTLMEYLDLSPTIIGLHENERRQVFC